MKITLFNFLSIIIPAIGISQPTFNSNDVPDFGATQVYGIQFLDTEFSFENGENKVWDLSDFNFIAEDTITLNYLSPENAPGGDTVSGCNMVLSFEYASFPEISYDYIDLNENAYTSLGYYAEDDEQFTRYDDPENIYEFPIEYGSSYSSQSRDEFTFFLGFDGIDSIKYISTNTNLYEVEAWGALSFNGNTYQVLKQKQTYISLDSNYNYIDGNWVFESANAYEDSAVLFIDPIKGGIVFSVSYFEGDKGQIDIQAIYFLDGNFVSVSETAQNNKADIFIYPNPAKEFFQVQFAHNDASLMSLYDVHGSLVLEKEMNSSVTNYVDATAVSAGFYFLKITDSKGEILGNQKVVINK